MRPIVAPHRTAAAVTLHAMPNDTRHASLDGTLYALRWFAVAGQFTAFAVANWGLRLELPWPPLLMGACALGLANALFGLWRQRTAASERRVLVGLAIDVAALTWALYFAGGVMNPFTQLFLVPVALTATALRPVLVVGVTATAAMAYLLIAAYAPPLAHQHSAVILDLHLTGMGANFALGLVLFCGFGLALAQRLRRQDAALRDERERRLRDEGLHALAMQSASAAHDLNTPLNTASLLVDEWRAAPNNAPSPNDLALMAEQLSFARDAVRRLAAAARESPPPQTVAGMMATLKDRLVLLRPQADLVVDIDPELVARRVQASSALWGSLGHLLENAADAGIAAGDARLVLRVQAVGERSLRLSVRDQGVGFDGASLGFMTSTKSGGLGLGFAIANATIDHAGGTLRVTRAHGGGTLSELELPWSALVPQREATR
jgi:two-component system sensor histidine kinase RegB